MIALANFIMRSRINALVVALGFSLVPLFSFLSSAAVALVTLRKGSSEGALVLLASLAPALIYSDGLLISHYGVSVAVYICALMLRQSVSLLTAVTTATFCGIGMIVAMTQWSADMLKPLEAMLSHSLAAQPSELTGAEIEEIAHLFTLQILGVGFFLSIITSLFLGRWWQACLYNPGGFQQEFHQMRMSPMHATALFAVAFMASQIEADEAAMAIMALLPIMFAALGLVHNLVKVNQTNIAWLVLFYISVLVMSAFGMMMLLLIGLADSIFDFRKKFQQDI